MKKITLLLLLFVPVLRGQSQLLKKYPVSNTGCSVYSFCEPKFDLDYSEDSSKVYTAECIKGDLHYGVICVKLLNTVDNPDQAEDLMMQYIEYLKASFNITQQAGAGHGLTMQGRTDIRGVVDFWTDQDKNNWKYKSWTDGKIIGFLYVYTQKTVPPNADLFLEGFRFPEKN